MGGCARPKWEAVRGRSGRPARPKCEAESGRPCEAKSGRPCEAVGGRAPLIGSDRSHDKLWEAEPMGGHVRPIWEAVRGRSERPCEAEVEGRSGRPKWEAKVGGRERPNLEAM